MGEMNEREPYVATEPTRVGRRVIAASALFLVLTACDTHRDGKSKQDLPFNHPPTGEYFHDVSDHYYGNLQRVEDKTDNPVAIENIERLKQTPISQWLNGANTREIINQNLTGSVADGSIPLFVLYNIPDRDLGSEAAGGVSNSYEYKAWINEVSDTVGDAPAIMIIEPDALPDIPNMMSESVKEERIAMLRDALSILRDNNTNTAVYLDAGHSGWLDANTTANLLRRVDPDGDLVGGISLNVSFQRSEEASRQYAADIAERLGRPLYTMIDNSMNGAKDTDKILEWCNPAGERIGTLDDYTYTAERVEEAYIKAPGESDGACGTSDKKAGDFDDDLLIQQVS